MAGTHLINPVVLIGSYALYKQHLVTEYKDIDFIADYDSAIHYIKKSCDKIKALYPICDGKKVFAETIKDGKRLIFEAEITWPGSTAEMIYKSVSSTRYYEAILNRVQQKPTEENEYIPTVSVLYALKRSHVFKDHISFEKTRSFLQKFSYLHGVELSFNWYADRKAEAEGTHPILNVSKKEFFRENESYNVYNHDDIHEAIKIGDMPAYTNFTSGEVEFSIQQFRNADKHLKLSCVYEEAAVLALERIVIMREIKGEEPGDLSAAFRTALIKVCTSITSGYFREFAYLEFDTILEFNSRYENEWYMKYRTALEENRIRKFSN